jgi:hypothetical protein
MIAIATAFVGPVADPDFWWHLRAGRWMVENGRLPSHDLFTYTVPGHVWTDHEYLTEVLMWLAYRGGGLLAISLGFGVVTWLGFLLLQRTSAASRPPFVVAGLGLALAAVAGAPIWGPRAQMITFLFSCLELYWLAGYLAGRSRALYWFPLLMVAWANLHGGWVIGFVFLGIAFLAEGLRWLLDRRPAAAAAHCRRLAIIGVLSLVAVLATPHGPALYLYPLKTIGSPAQESLIVEWFSPNFHENQLKPFEAMLLLAYSGFALRRPTLYQFLLTLMVTVFALQSVRNIALFVAAVTPILVETWAGVYRDLSERRPWFRRSAPAPTAGLAVVTAVALLLIAGATAIRLTGDLSRQSKATADSFPVGAADYLAAHPELGTRMFNQYGWGGYLAWRFYPDQNRKVFIFGEAELMGDPLLREYQDVQTLRPDWTDVLDRYQVDYVVYNRHEALDDVLAQEPDRWKPVYSDKVSIIYARVRS